MAQQCRSNRILKMGSIFGHYRCEEGVKGSDSAVKIAHRGSGQGHQKRAIWHNVAIYSRLNICQMPLDPDILAKC